MNFVAGDNEGTNIRTATTVFAVVVFAAVTLYFETFVSIVKTWSFDGYSHGYFILPICLYLVWLKRGELSGTAVAGSRIAVVALLILSAVWLLADNVGIQVIRQFAAVSMVPMSLLAVFGTSFARPIRFALGYLLFAVPFGEFLIPYLIDFTASFSVEALNLFGIPVFRDGQYFYVPSGSYEVAKACAGLSYIVATLALSVLYAHVLFTSLRKAVIFVAFAVALSIATNGIRATTIVLLLHYTNLDIAAGRDHEFVGWIFYGLMIAVVVWVGQRHADSKKVDRNSHASIAGPIPGDLSRPAWPLAYVGIAAIVAVMTGPVVNLFVRDTVNTENVLTSGLPKNVAGWTAVELTDSTWRPDFVRYSHMSLRGYLRSGNKVEVALIRYLGQNQGAELASSGNSVADLDEWALGNVVTHSVDLSSPEPVPVSEVIASRADESRLIWYWTQVSEVSTNGAFQNKLEAMRNMVSRKSTVASAIILTNRIDRSAATSRQVLRSFLKEFYLNFRKCETPNLNQMQCVLDAPNRKEI